MNNFFYNGSEYSLFKKALRATKSEPVVINILSTDSSLNDEKQESLQVERKSMSSKYEPSSFGRFFGPRKSKTTPVDMSNFSSWKNKNYRKVEENLSKADSEETTTFSLSDYMNKTMGENKFSDVDQVKSDSQKAITELSTDDPQYKKFSLDSYLQKLEEQNNAKEKFEENDDLLEPLGDMTQDVVPDSSQDEDFMEKSKVDAESLAQDNELGGDRFAFDKSDLDQVRNRLDKLEREANNIKDKPTEKLIDSNELTKIAKEGDFDGLLSEEDDDIKVDDIEKINEKLVSSNEDFAEDDENREKPQVKHKKFFEINKSSKIKGDVEEADEIDDNPTQKTKGLFDDEEDLTEDLDENFEKLIETIDEETPDNYSDGEHGETTVNISISSPGNGKNKSKDGEYVRVVGTDKNLDAKQEESNVDTNEVAESNKIKTDEVNISASEFGFNDNENDELDETEQSDENYIASQQKSHVGQKKIDREDIVTKDDLKSMSDDLLQKFTELYQEHGSSPNGYGYVEGYVDGYDESHDMQGQYGYGQPDGIMPYMTGQKGYVQQSPYSGQGDGFEQQTTGGQSVDMQEHILKMLEENKKADEETRNKLKKVEEEKTQLAQDYEKQISELKQAFEKKDEESKQKAYLDKLKNDIKLKKAETNFKLREKQIKETELESLHKRKIGENLRQELKNNLKISNLEMDKKLLETATKLKKYQEVEVQKPLEPIIVVAPPADEPEEKEVTKKPTKKKTTRRSHSHTRTPRRKIDSDIIGGIKFD